MQHIDLEDFAGGALSEKFNREFQQVIGNIQDPNTDAKKARKITMTVTFVSSAHRSTSQVKVDVKSTLAPAEGIETTFGIGKDIHTGELHAVEIGNQVPGQMQMAVRTDATADEGLRDTVEVVDQSTGEIYETPVSNVIDLRNTKRG